MNRVALSGKPFQAARKEKKRVVLLSCKKIKGGGPGKQRHGFHSHVEKSKGAAANRRAQGGGKRGIHVFAKKDLPL